MKFINILASRKTRGGAIEVAKAIVRGGEGNYGVTLHDDVNTLQANVASVYARGHQSISLVGPVHLRWGSSAALPFQSKSPLQGVEVVSACVDKMKSFEIAERAIQNLRDGNRWAIQSGEIVLPIYHRADTTPPAEHYPVIARDTMTGQRYEGVHRIYTYDDPSDRYNFKKWAASHPNGKWTRLTPSSAEMRIVMVYEYGSSSDQTTVAACHFFYKIPDRTNPTDPLFKRVKIVLGHAPLREFCLKFGEVLASGNSGSNRTRPICIGFDFLMLNPMQFMFLEANSAPWMVTAAAEDIAGVVYRHYGVPVIEIPPEAVVDESKIINFMGAE